MKLVFNREELVNVMDSVSKFVSTTGTMGVQKYVRIYADAENDRVTFDVVNAKEKGDGIRQALYDLVMDSPVTIEESGEVLLLVSELKEIVKEIKKPQLRIDVDLLGNQAVISSGKTIFKMSPYTNAKEFPVNFLDSGIDNTTTVVTMTADKLRELVAKVAYAAESNQDTARKPLLGVEFSLNSENSKIRVAATDSHRLAMFETETVSQTGDDRKALINAVLLKTLGEVLPKDDDEVVSLEFAASSVAVAWNDDGTKVVIRLLEGQLPDLSRVVPADFKADIILDKEEFRSLIKRGRLIARDSENVNILVSFYKDRLEATAKSADRGTWEDEMEVKSNIEEGIEFPVSFNTKYMLETLESLTGNEITIRYTGAGTAFTVTDSDPNALALMLPVRYQAAETTEKSA
jgi:DNA polymerase-3 subunit beta